MFETERCPENACNANKYAQNPMNAPEGMMGCGNMMNMGMDMNMGYGNMMNMGMDMNMGCPMNNCYNPCQQMCPPVMECPQEKICHKTINYQVPHMMPCHTKMVNHHVYHHTYEPCYSYSEVDEYSNVYDQRCC